MCRLISLNLISGFLGAGKTTVVTEIISQLKDKEKIAVLVNEFGKVGIDGDILQGKEIAVKEMPEGCICCTLKGSLLAALEEIAVELKPDRLLIEPTGLAQPGQIGELLQYKDIKKYYRLGSFITVVDALNYPRYYRAMKNMATEQLKIASKVIINKIDKVDKEEIESLLQIVKEANPGCSIFLTKYGEITSDLLLEGKSPNIKIAEELQKLPFLSYAYMGSGLYDPEKLKEVMQKLVKGEYGEVIRAKGFFKISNNRLLQVDLVMNEVNYQPVDMEVQSKFITIGQNLKEQLLEEHLDKCLDDGASSKEDVI